jgi:hypothetical protein
VSISKSKILKTRKFVASRDMLHGVGKSSSHDFVWPTWINGTASAKKFGGGNREVERLLLRMMTKKTSSY